MTPPLVPPAQPARLEHFHSLRWLPLNFKPKTLEGLAVIEQYWRNLFARHRVNDNVHKQMRRFLEHNKNTLDVDVFCITYRHYWVHLKHFRHRSIIIQFAMIQLWSAITGTQPGVFLPQKASLADTSVGKYKRNQTFQSNLPKYILIDDLPASVCYCDIKLFYLKDPDSKRDVLCAIIEFRNLKGRPEGADGTKFFMHGNYQLAYCPINQIILLAFCNNAFFNTKLTPDRQALRELGRDARFKDDIGHYNYCWWTANEVNWNFTSQEQQRVLGQSGNAHVVLLQPPQEGLQRVAGSMLRKWDLLTPSDLTDAQKDSICRNPRLRKSLEYFHTAPVLKVDRQIKQLLGQSNIDRSDADSSGDKDWEEPTLDYIFSEQAQLVENFYGPEAENFDKNKLLARYIQVTKDMVALLQLCKPNYSLRRHLINSYLAHAHDGISCMWPACHDIPKFTTATKFLAHAVTVHAYDINIKLHHLPTKLWLTCSGTSSVDSTVISGESDGRSGTDTPASSVGPETANIDPRLLESYKPKVTEPLLRRSKRLQLQ
ncbi:hypothetical protein BDW62DRAFT_215397 [Aspergillus aurantiobrunneus]